MTDKKTTPESSDKDLTANNKAPQVDETPKPTPKPTEPKVKPTATKPVAKKIDTKRSCLVFFITSEINRSELKCLFSFNNRKSLNKRSKRIALKSTFII